MIGKPTPKQPIKEHNDLEQIQGGFVDEYYHLTEEEHDDLTGGNQTDIHFHNSDRDRSNHTGSQPASTIIDFDSEVSNNASVSANTLKVSASGSVTTHNDIDSAGSGSIITTSERSKLNSIESGADVTDSVNVSASGATMNADTDISSNGWFLDEDDLVSNSSNKVPSQQSVKAYISSQIALEKHYKGGYDASTNTPDLENPASGFVDVGDVYDVTVAGEFFGELVEVGDTLRSTSDNPSSLSDWVILQANLDAAGIKAQYESNPNTNAYTDAEKNKLLGIEFSATENDTDANLRDRSTHTGTQPISTVSGLQSLLDSLVSPSGMIIAYGGSTPPSGYLSCNGGAYSRTTYADLFAVIGTQYGSGNGTTTFNVPDLRQRFPLGRASSGTGSTLGATGGQIDHTHTVNPPNTQTTSAGGHTHTGTTSTEGAHTHTGTTGGPSATANKLGGLGGVASANHTHNFTTSSAGGHDHDLEIDSVGNHFHFVNIAQFNSGTQNPPFAVVNYIIKV